MPESVFTPLVATVFADWYSAKIFVERSVAVSTDSLHVIAGVALQMLVAVVARRPLTNWLPWGCVLAALLFNEAVDLWVERWPSLAMQLGESAKDLLLTMLLPTLLTVALRWSPQLTGRASQVGNSDGGTCPDGKRLAASKAPAKRLP